MNAEWFHFHFWGFDPSLGHGLLLRGLAITHPTRQDSFGRVISPTQRRLPDNTQHSQEIDIHYRCGIRTHNPRNPVASDPRLRPRGHWDKQLRNVAQLMSVCRPVSTNVICIRYWKLIAIILFTTSPFINCLLCTTLCLPHNILVPVPTRLGV